MQNRDKKCGLILSAAVGLWAASPTLAGYTLNTLATFNNTNGAYPLLGSLTLSGSTLYGTTKQGGASGDGTVFSVPLAGGSPTTLATFNNTNGANPYAGLTLLGSTLYGTTGVGGAIGYGTVFSVPLAGGSPTTLATFNNTTNGATPIAGLTLLGSTLYGTTSGGGASGYGTVFSVPLAGGSPTTLATFNSTNGAYPTAGLALSGSTLYGTTGNGGANDDGTVFSVPLAGGSPTTLATFNITNGKYPAGGLTLSGSTLYGTTNAGGANGDGTVFSVPLAGGSPTTLATFNGTNGANPQADLTLSGSTLYGTTVSGGANDDGTVFSVPLAGGSPTTLATFNNTNGANPYSGLTLSGSTLYGTTRFGGANSDGTVFSLSPTVLNTSGGSTVTGGVSGFFTDPNTNGTLSSNYLEPTTPAALAAAIGAVAAGQINFVLPGTTDQLWDISYSDAFTGDGTITVHFDPSAVSGPLSDLYIEHYTNGAWVIPPDQMVDTTNDTITFQTDSFSPFILATTAAVPEPASLSLLAIGGVALLGRRRAKRISN